MSCQDSHYVFQMSDGSFNRSVVGESMGRLTPLERAGYAMHSWRVSHVKCIIWDGNNVVFHLFLYGVFLQSLQYIKKILSLWKRRILDSKYVLLSIVWSLSCGTVFCSIDQCDRFGSSTTGSQLLIPSAYSMEEEFKEKEGGISILGSSLRSWKSTTCDDSL